MPPYRHATSTTVQVRKQYNMERHDDSSVQYQVLPVEFRVSYISHSALLTVHTCISSRSLNNTRISWPAAIRKSHSRFLPPRHASALPSFVKACYIVVQPDAVYSTEERRFRFQELIQSTPRRSVDSESKSGSCPVSEIQIKNYYWWCQHHFRRLISTLSISSCFENVPVASWHAPAVLP